MLLQYTLWIVFFLPVYLIMYFILLHLFCLSSVLSEGGFEALVSLPSSQLVTS